MKWKDIPLFAKVRINRGKAKWLVVAKSIERKNQVLIVNEENTKLKWVNVSQLKEVL